MQLMFGREVRSPLEGLRPSAAPITPEVHPPVDLQPSLKREFCTGDLVNFRLYRRSKKHFVPGRVTSRLGRAMYTVEAEDGQIHKRHVDQMERRHAAPDQMVLQSQNIPPPAAPEVQKELPQCPRVGLENAMESPETAEPAAQAQPSGAVGQSGTQQQLQGGQSTSVPGKGRGRRSLGPATPVVTPGKRESRPPVRYGWDPMYD